MPTGRHTWLKQERDRVHGPGEINACDLERVRAVAPAGAGLVATVLLQGRDQLGATKVFRPDETERDITERPLEVDELEQLFVEYPQGDRGDGVAQPFIIGGGKT